MISKKTDIIYNWQFIRHIRIAGAESYNYKLFPRGRQKYVPSQTDGFSPLSTTIVTRPFEAPKNCSRQRCRNATTHFYG
jgi:hypothetical protein